MFIANNGNTRIMCKNRSKLTITSIERQWRRSDVFIVNFGQILHINLSCVFIVDFEQINADWICWSYASTNLFGCSKSKYRLEGKSYSNVTNKTMFDWKKKSQLLKTLYLDCMSLFGMPPLIIPPYF